MGSESNQASSEIYLSGFIVGLETRELSGGFIELPSEFREVPSGFRELSGGF